MALAAIHLQIEQDNFLAILESRKHTFYINKHLSMSMRQCT